MPSGFVVRVGERHRDVGERVDVGEPPRLGAVGEVAVGEHDHRRAVLQREAHALERGVEAVARRLRGDDRQRRLAVAPVHREQEVGLLGLGGQTGGRAAALHVDEHERQLHADREPERLGLEVDAGTARGGDAELAGERAADRDADRGDLVLGLHRAHAEVLVLRQLVEDVGRGRDRVRRVQDRQLAIWPAAISPYDSATLPLMLRYGPAGDCAGATSNGWSNSSAVSPKL